MMVPDTAAGSRAADVTGGNGIHLKTVAGLGGCGGITCESTIPAMALKIPMLVYTQKNTFSVLIPESFAALALPPRAYLASGNGLAGDEMIQAHQYAHDYQHKRYAVVA